MAKPQPALHLVDVETGEITEQACPHCVEKQHTLDELTRKYHGALSQLGKLRRDKAAEARAHRLWHPAVCLFVEWKIATGHDKSRWSETRFWQCEPHLGRHGFVIARWAVWGVAYMPGEKRFPNGHIERYDGWHIPFADDDAFERYAKRGYSHVEARKRFSLREQGVGPDDETISPVLYFQAEAA